MMQISFRHIPSSSALFLDYLDNWSSVQPFYPQVYSLESIIKFARQRPQLDSRHVDVLCTALSEQQKTFGARERGVEKLARGAVAVVAGQQPGLFTGPMLSVFKAISAIKLARSLEEAGVSA